MKIDSDSVLKLIHGKIALFRFFGLIMPKKYRKVMKEFEKLETEVQMLVRAEKEKPIYKIETNLFDEEKIYPNCTVQVLHNSVTDEYSVGWWDNERSGHDEP